MLGEMHLGYKWRSGRTPPKGVSADQAAEAIMSLGEEINPEDLLEASKKDTHVFHDDLWSEGDQVWANRARLDRCKELITSVTEEYEIGGKVYETRSFEYVKSSYRTIETISQDNDMISELLNEVSQQLGYLQAKLQRITNLRK